MKVYLVKDKLSGHYVCSYCDNIKDYYTLSSMTKDLINGGIKFELFDAVRYMEDASDEFSIQDIEVNLCIVEHELSLEQCKEV